MAAKKVDEAELEKMNAFIEDIQEDLDEIKSLNDQVTALNAKITEVKTRINEAMEADGVRTVKCDFLTITTTDERVSKTIDWEKLKVEDPECYEGLLKDYPTEPSVDEAEFEKMEGREYLEIVEKYPLIKTTKGSRSYKFAKEKN